MFKLKFFEAFGQNGISEYSMVIPYMYYKYGTEIPYPAILKANMAAWLKEEDCIYV